VPGALVDAQAALLLALAERRLGEVAGGRGQLLFVAGEAGIGKPRLLATVGVGPPER
jgi:predicted ATPase